MKEIKNTTIYSKEKLKEFLEIYYFDKIKGIRIVLNILIGVIIISFFLSNKKTIPDIITFDFALFGIIELNTTMIPKLNLLRLSKKENNIINNKITYIFKKNNFKLNKDEYIDYNTLKKVIETNSSYYLYINNSKSLIVDKSSLNTEDIEILTNILKEKVSTYIKKNVW